MTICSSICYRIVTEIERAKGSYEQGEANEQGAGSPIYEQGKVRMTFKLSECIRFEIVPPGFILNATTGLMRLYPAFLKASQLLQRFVQ